MNAMIFAAGLGTRLFPLTESKPKALVEVRGKPLIWYALQNVIQAGATTIVVNVHHFANQVIEYLKTQQTEDIDIIISDETDELLETGGGLLKAAPLFKPGQPILIHNADVLTNCNLKLLIGLHQQNKALATLMVEKRHSSRYFLFDNESRLCGWENTQRGDRIIALNHPDLHQFAFDGIHMVDYSILKLMGEVCKFSITNGYLDLAAHHSIFGWNNWDGQWFDVGTIEKLEIAEREFVIH